jgi:hypothetical protein
MDTLAELRAREEEVAREWHWLHEALNEVARVRAENGDAAAFRLMQGQAMRVGQRWIQLSLRIASMEGPPGRNASHGRSGGRLSVSPAGSAPASADTAWKL